MSASAPLGRPSTNTGSVDALCTSATQIGTLVSEVMTQAAATSFIHWEVLAANQANHIMRNTGLVKGASGEPGGGTGVGVSSEAEDGMEGCGENGRWKMIRSLAGAGPRKGKGCRA